MMRLVAAMLLLGAAAPAMAGPLTVRTGETWLFRIEQGQPANARKVAPAAKPASGEVKVALRALFGTMMTITNNSGQGYTLNAQLIVGGKPVAARTCTLPPGNQPALESWPQKAQAVRIGDFKPATGGNC